MGEAPGATEDSKGIAFVGVAGRRLDDALDLAGLTDVWITNVVRCRPPMNATPTADEMTTCANLYLHPALHESPARIIVALGAVARSEFFPGFDAATPQILPMGMLLYSAPHPMATLHNRALYPKLVETLFDAKQLREKIRASGDRNTVAVGHGSDVGSSGK